MCANMIDRFNHPLRMVVRVSLGGRHVLCLHWDKHVPEFDM